MAEQLAEVLRVSELQPGKNGLLQTQWYLTKDSVTDTVKLILPPPRALPIVFVPGIMGSNLADLKGKPVWLLNSGVKDIPVGLAFNWARKNAGARQSILHPSRTKVYKDGAVPDKSSQSVTDPSEYLRRGWGEVSQSSYHKFLLWLDNKMNSSRNPAQWTDFLLPSIGGTTESAKNSTAKLPPGLAMDMLGLPRNAERGHPVVPIRTDDLLARAKFMFPVYAFGYNWLASNNDAAKFLKDRIDKIISENNNRSVKCTQVILVTHSMGGLVARACSQLPEMSGKIAGVVHGVMPATGAAVAYRRCKVGMKDEDFGAGLVIGSDGKEVTAVFAQAPGALQLLPSEDYGVDWLHIADAETKLVKSMPSADPYEEIYLQRNRWWGLVREEWLEPKDGLAISWQDFAKNVRMAKAFHQKISKKFHGKTYVFYGGGDRKGSFSKIRWDMKNGKVASTKKGARSPADVVNMTNKEVRTDGSNHLYLGATKDESVLDIRCAKQDSNGDGTVPASSGSAPRQTGSEAILQQFEIADILHEPAYRDYSVTQQVTYYAVTKIASMADLS